MVVSWESVKGTFRAQEAPRQSLGFDTRFDQRDTLLARSLHSKDSMLSPYWHPWDTERRLLETSDWSQNLKFNNTLLPPDAPALDSVSCPDRITWLEGTEASLSCVAHGVPPPNVSCVRSGEAEVVEGLLLVAREHAGTYRCEATNARGSAAKTVAVTVECE